MLAVTNPSACVPESGWLPLISGDDATLNFRPRLSLQPPKLVQSTRQDVGL
jgi:hypothetical protein